MGGGGYGESEFRAGSIGDGACAFCDRVEGTSTDEPRQSGLDTVEYGGSYRHQLPMEFQLEAVWN